MLSAWSFICMFAVVPFFQPFDLFSRHASAHAKPSHREHVIRFFADFAFGLLLLVTVIVILQNPYGSERYRPAQLAVFAAAVGVLVALRAGPGVSQQTLCDLAFCGAWNGLAPHRAAVGISDFGIGSLVDGYA